MSKELEALERIKNKFIDFFHEDVPDFDIIEEALQRLESIDNAKPSRALEYLENLGTHRIEYIEGFELGYTKTMPFKSTYDYKTIQYALLKAQEQEKVLDVIFKKQFNPELFRNVLISVGGRFEYKEYERVYTKYGKEKVTEEEFDTLKRYFK